MTPLIYYQEQCSKNLMQTDSHQLHALKYLEEVYQSLLHEQRQRTRILSKWRKPKLIKGIYLWGGVGIGKTFLMDCFYQCLPFTNKMRMHFHQFMRFVHQQLKIHEGKKDPLKIIAKEISKKNMVLCFDEFVVSDITDAMLIARLFQMLFEFGVCLVATSNQMPDDLYKHGLQRPLFLPAIKNIKLHTTVIHMTTKIDYRLQYLKRAGVFYTPHDEHALQSMEKTFAIFANDEPVDYAPIEINGRTISIIKQVNNIIWFDFKILCSTPRSQQDYLVIAEKYHTIFLSDIKAISAEDKNKIALFIRMIDIFYDKHIRLIFSAAVAINEIYTQGYLLSDYMRAQSRLIEMQSENYFIQEL